MSIATPEGIELELVLAGAGSRVIAGLLDALLKLLLILAVALVLGGTGSDSGFAVAIWAIAVFVVLFGYDVFFELAASGRTPGKRWSGLQVLRADGSAVTVGASVVRNLLRVVDSIPGVYLVGILVVALTKRHQRVGDLVGGTIVVRERREVGEVRAPLARNVHPDLATWDVSAITPEEEAAVRRFLERRGGLDLQARNRLAGELAARLRPKVVGPDAMRSPEGFLEDLVDARSLRR